MKMLPVAAVTALLLLTTNAFAADKCDVKVGSKAPPFSVSMADGSEGVVLRKALEKKVPVVVVFWAHHCKPCVHELPTLQTLADEVGSQVSFLLIHDGPDEALMKAKLAELKVTLPSASDDTRAKEDRYCVKELPRTFLLDGTGIIRAIFEKADDKLLRSELTALGVKVKPAAG
jgi:thiol-disulfide isomerase/thioredoxin